MNKDEAIRELEKRGYDWMLNHSGGKYLFVAYKPGWVGKIPASLCPHSRAETETDAIGQVYEKVTKQ